MKPENYWTKEKCLKEAEKFKKAKKSDLINITTKIIF
jgi:hypothetical protein